MKIIIYYATKHGAAEEIAKRLARALGDADTVNLAGRGILPPEAADRVIVGGSVYAGMLRKEMRDFLTRHQEVLAEKPLGLYLSGMSEDACGAALEKAAPAVLTAAAKVKDWLGGIVDPAKLSFFERAILRMVTGKCEPMDTADQARIDAFAARMMEG
ncbi:MAG: flavodoxin domain-containing protein [Clostridia bacterium]|nr:flavodoxin domain-containing protein [Clostridia bacterium]